MDEFSPKDDCYPLRTDDSIKKSRRRGNCSTTDTGSKKDQPMLHVINSVESKWLYETGKLVEKIEFFRKQSGIEHVFVTLHFAESPQHFSYLRVHKSKSVIMRSRVRIVAGGCFYRQ